MTQPNLSHTEIVATDSTQKTEILQSSPDYLFGRKTTVRVFFLLCL